MEILNQETGDALEKLAQRAAVEDRPQDQATDTAGDASARVGDHLPHDVERLRYEKAGERARQLMAVIEWGLKKKDDRLSLPESAYQEAAPRLAPLMLKHGLDEYGLPDWLQPYREEVAALVFFLGIGAGVGLQLWQLRAQDMAAAEAAAAAGQPDAAARPVGGNNPYAWAGDP